MKKKIILLFFTALFMGGIIHAQSNNEIIELNAQSFRKLVWDYKKDTHFSFKGKTPVIIDFYATWCGPCKMLHPELLALQEMYKGKVQFYRVDVDKEKEIALLFGIKSMPTLVFMKEKTQYSKTTGYRKRDELKKIIDFRFF